MYDPQRTAFPAAPTPGGAVSNTSGMGRHSDIPAEIRGWNWGAFLLNLFWGIGNNTWVALLMLVPFLNWVLPFFLGALGSQWAWQNRRWRSVEHFRRVQRRWAVAGLVVWIAVLGITIGVPVLVYRALSHNPIQELALTTVRLSPEAVTLLGTPIRMVDRGGPRFSGSFADGRFAVEFQVAGPHGSATVDAQARLTQGGWNLERVLVRPAGGTPLTVFPRQRL